MKPHRVLWQILPQGGLFRWKLLRDGQFIRSFLFQKGAIGEANRMAAFEWEAYRYPSEIQIHNGATGQIREKNTYPRSTDPKESEG